MSLLEIDEALDLLIESAAEQVSGPEGSQNCGRHKLPLP